MASFWGWHAGNERQCLDKGISEVVLSRGGMKSMGM